MDIDHKHVMRRALLDAAATLIANNEDGVTPSKMVLRVIAEAMETLRRLPDPEAAWLYSQRSLWPEVVRSYEEKIEAYYQELNSWLREPGVADRRRMPASPEQIRRMYVVFDNVPYLLVGRDPRRDYRILCGIASGKSAARVAKEVHVSKRSVFNYLDMQLQAIASALRDVMPDDRAIEALRGKIDVEREMRRQRFVESGGDLSVLRVS